MHFLRRMQVAYLKIDKVFTKISSEYNDFADIFLLKLAIKLLKYTKINNYIIELLDDL